MRSVLLALLSFTSLFSTAQLLSFEEWQVRSDADIRLKPRYGDRGIGEVNAAVDEDVFVMITNNRDKKLAVSDSLVKLGWERLKKNDHVGSMVRFNEAWLAMPKNPEVHRAFGAYFMSMKRPLEAHDNFQAGIAIDSTYAPLLKEEALAYMQERYQMQQEGRTRKAEINLDNAYTLLVRAHDLDPRDPVTVYNLFICYVLKLNCPKAWEFHDKVVAMKERTIEDMYLARLKESCSR